MKVILSAAELETFLDEVFPQVSGDFSIEDLSDETCVMRMKVSDKHLRPGGTVSGPSMFALADVCFYVAVMARIGREALTVTTNCTIDFMRKPEATDMLARARVLKMGRTLAVGDVLLFSDGMEEPVARANLTYAIPPKR